MPEALGVEGILRQAAKQEKEYHWLEAIESYKNALCKVPEQDFSRRAEIHERLGYALHRAAMQAENIREFRTSSARSLDNYEKAKELYGKRVTSGKTPWMLRCDAFIAYLNNWLTSEVTEKERLLDECWNLTKEALNRFKEAGDAWEYGKTYNQLSVSALFRFFYDWDYQTREFMVREAADYGEQAIRYLSSFGDLHELARAYVRTATYREMLGFYFLDLDKRQIDYQKALDYWLKANELSEEAAHIELLNSCALAALESLGWEWGTDTTLMNFSRALKHGRKTKDRLIIGLALDWLAFHTLFNAEACETREDRVELIEKAVQYAKDAKQQYLPISFTSALWGALWTEAPYPLYYWYLANYEPDPERKRDLLGKAVEAAADQLKRSEGSGYPEVLMFAHHTSSDIFLSLARIEKNSLEKKRLLEKALAHQNDAIGIIKQFIPFYYWKRGKMQTFVADIKSELADLVKEPELKKSILQEAVLDKENSLKLAIRYAEFWEGKGSIPALFADLGNWQYGYGDMLNRLYEFTRDREHLGDAIIAFGEATQTFKKLNLISRMAECYWKTAQTCDMLSEHLNAANNFSIASDNYLKAAERIPQLKDFYKEHAFYMQAWSEIEKAKHHHLEKQYGQAKEHYGNAAKLHRSTERWNFLSPNYLAWTQLEEAEDQSREEQTEKAKDLFQQAAKLFAEAKQSIKANLEKIEVRDEKELATELVKASDIREKYCVGRIALEEAKILYKKGDYTASSKKYGSAAEMFQKTAEVEPEQSRKELQPIIYLCQAWQKMMMAEAKTSSTMYGEAAELFKQAKEHTLDQPTSLLALAHSSFCKALEAGTKFEITRDMTMYSTAKKHMGAAANHYLKAGVKTASEHAKATQRLFDAYAYMDKAKMETNPDRKAKYFLMAEKVLQASAGSYLKAKHPEKSEEVHRLLGIVREERELAISLSKILHAPIISSSTASFVSLTPREEKAVGLERFEQANIQANLVQHEEEIVVGEDFNLEIQIANVGRATVLLDKVEGILPPGFKPVAKPHYCHFEDTYVDMKGKRLDPLKTEEIRLVFRPFIKGTFDIKPRIIYADVDGHRMFCEPQPATISVSMVVLPNRITTGHEYLDNLLFGGIPENYAIILTSPSCDEGDLLIKKFLEAGVEEGQITFYITPEVAGAKALAEGFQPNLYLFICNPQAEAMVKSLPNVFKLKGVENLTDVNIALTSAFRKLDKSLKGPRRACIEIISDVLLQHRAVQTRRWLTRLLPELKSKGFTTLAIMNPHMHSQQEVHAILDLFEGEIGIFEKETEKGLEKFLEIKKMHNERYLENTLPLRKEKPKTLRRGAAIRPKPLRHAPQPRQLTVYTPLLFKFKSEVAEKTFNYLVQAFIEDYMKRRLFVQDAGWRSFVQIIKGAKVSFRSVYGDRRHHGSAISELERRGLIETRIFPRERGRGGRIVRARISYEKETMKRYIDHKVVGD